MTLLDKGRHELSAGNWVEAKKILEEAVNENPSAEVFEELAQACWWVNDTASVLIYREKAYQLFLDKNDKYGASRNASFLGIDYLELKGDFAIANGWFTRAETILEGLEPSLEEGLIKLLKGRQAFLTEPTNDSALRLINESIAINKSLGSADGYMIAEAMKGFILTTEGKIKEGMALLDEATLIATTADTKNINFVALTCCMLIEACERVRDFERAGQWCDKVKEICTRWQFDVMFSSCRNLYSSVLVWKGEWKEAEHELITAAKELKITRPMYASASAVHLAELRRKQGRWDETQHLLENAGTHTLKLLSCAALAFDKDDLTAAANFAERFLRQVPGKEKTRKIAGLELLIRIYVAQEKINDVIPVLNELKEIASEINTPPLHASVKSAEGILEKASGKYDTARQLFEDAIDLFDKINAPFEAACIRLELAEVLIILCRFHLAESELNNASKTFQTLGAKKDFEKTKFLLKNMHTTNAELQAMNTTLEFTGRELEVLQLIAEGKNNEEIAGQLFLSVRTIEKHITNLYLKMGVSGKSARAFAASYAIKHHLIFT
jgi:DNA-binding CsgD family transcriptional regulator